MFQIRKERLKKIIKKKKKKKKDRKGGRGGVKDIQREVTSVISYRGFAELSPRIFHLGCCSQVQKTDRLPVRLKLKPLRCIEQVISKVGKRVW